MRHRKIEFHAFLDYSNRLGFISAMSSFDLLTFTLCLAMNIWTGEEITILSHDHCLLTYCDIFIHVIYQRFLSQQSKFGFSGLHDINKNSMGCNSIQVFISIKIISVYSNELKKYLKNKNAIFICIIAYALHQNLLDMLVQPDSGSHF